MPPLTDLWEGEHLSDAALLRFQQGNLPPDALLEVDAHLSACEECKSRLRQMLDEQGITDKALVALTQAFSREGVESPVSRVASWVANFPEFASIASYVDGTLSPAERATFETALTRFPELSQEVANLRALQQELRAPAPAESIRVPPMIVRRPTEATTTSGRKWWERLVWPLQTFGATAFAALLLIVFGISPLKQQLSKRQEQIMVERTRSAQASNKQQAAESGQRRAQLQAKASQKKVSQLQQELGQKEDQIKKLKEARQTPAPPVTEVQTPVPVSTEAPEPTALPEPTLVPKPRPTPIPTRNGGTTVEEEQGLQTLFDQRGAAPDFASLRKNSASAPKGEEVRFRLISPVGTKIQEVRPTLRWKKVPGATQYLVKITDESDSSSDTQSVIAPLYTATKALTRGHRYKWEVTAIGNGKIIGQAPRSPDAEGLFEVLSETETKVLQENLKKVGKLPLLQISLLIAAGLKEEAQERLRLLQQQRKR